MRISTPPHRPKTLQSRLFGRYQSAHQTVCGTNGGGGSFHGDGAAASIVANDSSKTSPPGGDTFWGTGLGPMFQRFAPVPITF